MKKQTKKFFALALAATTVLSATSFVACGGDNPETDESGRTLIRFMGWGDVYEQMIFQTMVDDFMEKYPQYNVKYIPVQGGDYAMTLKNKVKNPKEMPDVFYMPDTNFVQWANDAGSEVMLNLTPYIEKSTVFSVDNVWSEAIYAYRYDEKTKQMGTGDIWALPKDVGPYVCVYNKNLAAESGITVIHDEQGTFGYDPSTKTLNDQVAMTWAQYVAFCQEMSDLEGSKKVYGCANYPLDIALRSNNADFTDETHKNSTLNANDYKNFAESVQFIGDLVNEYKVMPQDGANKDTTVEAQAINRFQNGTAGVLWTGAWYTNTLWTSNFDWDILPVPVPNESGNLTATSEPAREGCEGRSYLGSVGLAVYAGSKVKEGAYLLAEYLTVDPEAQKVNYQLGMAVPNLVDMAKGEFLTATLNDSKGFNRPQNRKVYIDVIENSLRRIHAYTYDDKWTDELFNSSVNDYKYSMQRVWSSTYGTPIKVYNYATGVQNKDFLAGIYTNVQAALDKNKNKYEWKVNS